jgi:cation:H+ antiporter
LRDGTALAVATLLCIALALFGMLSRPWGAGFVALLTGYIGYTYLRERTAPAPSAAMVIAEAAVAPKGPVKLWLSGLMTAGGIVLTILGARLLVSGAIEIAALAGISETVIGLTVVAIGTSLPELVTSVMAAMRRQSDIAFGNVVGSNIYNILGILGITALVKPIPVPAEIARVDVWVMAGATVLLIVFSVTGWRLNRAEGAAFLAGYAAYFAWLFAGAA